LEKKMAFGAVEFSQIGDQNQPSPAVWGDCPNTLLSDKSMGYFAHEEFLGNIEVASLADASVFGSGVLSLDADTGALAPLTGKVGGYAKFSTGATDNNALAIYSPPLGKLVRNSGNKLWMEVSLQFAALSDQALFVGFTTEANATRDVIADDPSNSAVAGLTAATVIGFVTKQTASAIATVDAKYAKGTGTPVTVLADVTNATAIPAASRASLAATTDLKLGIRFDGRTHLHFFVNGYKVATQEVDATFDQSSNLCFVLNSKTGAGVARAVSSDWMRYAFQTRN
jgi:hypothetical protein